MIALNNARAKSRDAKRAGDIKQIQTALELFFNDNNRYPTSTEWMTGKIFSTSTSGTSTYLQVIPTAPSPSDGDCEDNQNTINYQQTEGGSSYAISFCLGNTTGTLSSGPKCLTPGGVVDVDCTPLPPWLCGDVLADSRDGQSYPTILVGAQCWFAKNLNVVDPDNDSVEERYCSYNSTANCDTYGGLYDHPTAEIACPVGWRLPTKEELGALETLYDSVGIPGFNILLAGMRYPADLLWYHQGYGANFWASDASWSQNFFNNAGDPDINTGWTGSNWGYSVRCLQE